MDTLLQTVLTGITVFAVTNIDDILILVAFFAETKTRAEVRRVVIGQYLGIGALTALSSLSFLGTFFLPRAWIGFIGLLPVIIGVKKLYQLITGNEEDSEEVKAKEEISSALEEKGLLYRYFHPQTAYYTVVTFANGGDNIGIYVPLFANSTLGQLLTYIGVFALMTGVWCAVSYYFVSHRGVARVVERVGPVVVPVVLIGLGFYIMYHSGTFALIAGR
ncbi:MAG: cadmium resistance transporter [Clostridia bacterium]|nr:cadmium resistance transporter [Clostridia bacterium]